MICEFPFFYLWGHSKLTYLRALKDLLCIVFMTLISHYGKFTALHKLIVCNWQIKSSKNFQRDHAVPGLFLKSYSEDKVAYLSRVDSGKLIVKNRLSSKGVTSPNQCCWQRHSCLRGLNDNKGLFSKFILLTSQSDGRGKKLCRVIQLTKTFNKDNKDI